MPMLNEICRNWKKNALLGKNKTVLTHWHWAIKAKEPRHQDLNLQEVLEAQDDEEDNEKSRALLLVTARRAVQATISLCHWTRFRQGEGIGRKGERGKTNWTG